MCGEISEFVELLGCVVVDLRSCGVVYLCSYVVVNLWCCQCVDL